MDIDIAFECLNVDMFVLVLRSNATHSKEIVK